MYNERWRQAAELILIVGLVMAAGLSARADDEPRKEPEQNPSPVGVREIRVTQTQDQDGQPIEERSVLLAIDSEATTDETVEEIEQLLDEPAVAGDPESNQSRVLRFNAAPAGDILTVTTEEQEEELLGKHWIGVQIHDVPPALRAQLNLEEGQGVLVGEVFPDSPASKADLKEHDIILSINDEKIGGNEQVLKTINAADGKELKLKILRGGSERSLNITPTERPESQRARPRRVEQNVLRDWVRRVQPQATGDILRRNPHLQFDVVRPGAGLVLNTETARVAIKSPEMPDGLSISVTREGKNPAKISIKQKEREIETTEDKIDELPEDLRRYVMPMLGRPQRAALNLRGGGIAPGPVPNAPRRPGAPPRPVPPHPDPPPHAGGDVLIPAPPGQEGPRARVRVFAEPRAGGVEGRIQDLERRLEELQRSIRHRDEAKEESKN